MFDRTDDTDQLYANAYGGSGPESASNTKPPDTAALTAALTAGPPPPAPLTSAEIAERDSLTIESLVGEGKLGGRRLRGRAWRLWNPVNARMYVDSVVVAEVPLGDGTAEYGMIDIYLNTGHLFRQGKRIEGTRGIRGALRLLGILNVRTP